MSERLTQGRLKELLHYDPATGILTARVERRGGNGLNIVTVAVGAVLGTPDQRDGRVYLRVCIDYRKLYAHRIAWFYMTGRWPRNIDHRDGDGLNNKWSNLRAATSQQNAQNARISKNNKSGFKGVSPGKRSGQWRATIVVDRKQIWLGNFPSAELASEAYQKVASSLFGDFARV